MNTEKNLSVVGLFPKDATERIQKLRVEISEKFDVHDALNWPPHLTLRPGFHVSPERMQGLTTEFKQWVSSVDPIPVELRGFKFYEGVKTTPTIRGHYAITIDVQNTKELQAAHEKLLEFTPVSMQAVTRFNPHVTLAYNDVDETQFHDIQDFLKDKTFSDEFTIDTVGLFHNTGLGTKRELVTELHLGK